MENELVKGMENERYLVNVAVAGMLQGQFIHREFVHSEYM